MGYNCNISSYSRYNRYSKAEAEALSNNSMYSNQARLKKARTRQPQFEGQPPSHTQLLNDQWVDLQSPRIAQNKRKNKMSVIKYNYRKKEKLADQEATSMEIRNASSPTGKV